ncbi:Terpenoid cyclases/protein prenyltransferase alpha-alpha toroid protein [Dioscorea alata]|uniref:Terpenoid cyclases/protein prenyltransferase alpha-alpha toroid protein n=1 Tax=Dioscorea alata TaxID=55571 RepID=A0ACB7UZF4_DIOAL|nr:Terpenoid cyclases/protein prenyltransferase alpha-alpha toroid protein [Dioscorea alata]
MACSHFQLTSLGFTTTALSTLPRFPPSHEQCNKNIINVQKCSHMISNIKAQHSDYSSSSSSVTQRRSANFQPTIWTNDYLQSLKDNNFMEEKFTLRIEKLKDATKQLLHGNKDIIHQLKLIDTLRQLGVAYHFEREIKDVIGLMGININILKNDLFATALLFRLLREYGFKVSQGVFDGFKDEKGNFQLSISSDINGMLSLYEASHLVMEGEDTLDKARIFTTNHLKTILKEENIDPILKEHVVHALEMPTHWRMPRLHTHWFIGMYEKEDNMNPNLLEFAKLDFNMVQSIYQGELKQCSRWDINDIDCLPKYMKKCFLSLFNTTNDIAYKVLKMRNVNCIPYLKKSWLELCKAYLVEANWAHSDYKPKMKEYLDNAWISIAAFPILIHSFFCITEDISKEALESLENFPNIMRQSFLIFRLCNDLGTSTEEVNRGDVKKSIQCYMYEKGVSETIAREYVKDLIRETWKELNTNFYTMSSPFDVSFKNLAMDIARMTQCIYEYGDGYGLPENETKDRALSLLIKPISLDTM